MHPKTTDFARASLFAGILSLCTAALADPPSPKVCVAVAGDPDESARAAAEALTSSIGQSDSLRGVADADSRAALRGEASAPVSARDLSESRRALRGNDQDQGTLDAIAQRLGCAWLVEVCARPAGLSLRLYDAVHRSFHPGPEPASFDAAIVSRWIVPATRAAPPTTPPAALVAPAARPQADPRASATQRPQTAQRATLLERSWPWFVAGAAAAGVITVFLLTRDEPAGDVQFRVVHGGAR